MKKHRFLVLSLLFLALVCMGLVAVPRASAHTLQSTPPNQSFTGGACTPIIAVVGGVQVTPGSLTISLNSCAQQAILAGSTPNDISTFTVTFQYSQFSLIPWYWLETGSSDGSTFYPLSYGFSQMFTNIVANHLNDLVMDYTTCGNTNATFYSWADINSTGEAYWQQLSTNAVLQSGCNQSLTPGA